MTHLVRLLLMVALSAAIFWLARQGWQAWHGLPPEPLDYAAPFRNVQDGWARARAQVERRRSDRARRREAIRPRPFTSPFHTLPQEF